MEITSAGWTLLPRPLNLKFDLASGHDFIISKVGCLLRCQNVTLLIGLV
ncbi:Hypothetical protein LOCK908_1752 [Lacticaseibacillus rhamnosus LOCK908]|nr:Hypothetical protein LOCK908_1752 [Lacticaseibacillus rhamnosus LOCK908]